MSRIRVIRVLNESDIRKARQVLKAVYVQEKKWMTEEAGPDVHNPFVEPGCSWFLAQHGDKPAGILRLRYDPCLDYPENIGLQLNGALDIKRLTRGWKIVEIGRFGILPECRSSFLIAIRLMNRSLREVVQRGYTHFITDVFEDEPTSPYRFHSKVLGFEVIGRHLYGELHCSRTRIIMTLDILKAYQRMKENRNRVYLSITRGIRTLLEARIEGLRATDPK